MFVETAQHKLMWALYSRKNLPRTMGGDIQQGNKQLDMS